MPILGRPLACPHRLRRVCRVLIAVTNARGLEREGRGGLRETNNMRRDWRAFRDRHKLGDWFTPYTFRRTVATLLTDKLPAREASDLLGHSRISQTTDTYGGRKIISRNVADVLGVLGGG